MATKDEIRIIKELLDKNAPGKGFERINKGDVGLFAVLRYLDEFGNDISSVDISNYLRISSARMTVLLKKMEHKGLIIKNKSVRDARAIEVSLTDKGQKLINEFKEKMNKSISRIIDEFGVDEIRFLFKKINVIKEVFNDEIGSLLEVNND